MSGLSTTADRPISLLSSYSDSLFVPLESWRLLESMLSQNAGVTLALSGPRGAGKSWLMHRAMEWAKSRKGLGLYFPSPSEYESTAFICALSDVVATAYQEYYDDLTERNTKASRRRNRRLFSLAAVLYLAAYLFAMLGVGVLPPQLPAFVRVLLNPFLGISIALLLMSVVTAVYARRRYREEKRGLGRVRSAAEDLRMQVRYVVTTKESTELGAEGKQGPLSARFKRARERQLVDRPATLSSLVHNFRAFVTKASTSMDGTPIVIAIDELDKLTDAERVIQLLRDIKGVFEIPGVHVLTSISDEAARHLELGGIKSHNEFNSSFSSVLPVPPLPPGVAIQVFERRNGNLGEVAATTIGVMAGGVAREVVRLGDGVSRRFHRPSVEDVVYAVLTEELYAFREEVANLPGRIGDEHKLSVVAALPDAAFSEPDGLFDLGANALTLWDAVPITEAGDEVLVEEWRRLLTRLSAGYLLIQNPEILRHQDSASRLQLILRLNAVSAALGRAKLGHLSWAL